MLRVGILLSAGASQRISFVQAARMAAWCKVPFAHMCRATGSSKLCKVRIVENQNALGLVKGTN